jgi:hypothetical protein
MNDEFLTKYHKTPRAAFADALYERISQQPQPRFQQTIVIKLTFRNAAVAFLFMLLIAACVYAVVEKRWNKVGDIWVDVWTDDVQSQQSLAIQASLWKGHDPGDMEVPNLTEAKSALDFEFGFPTWAPEGFVLADQIYISPSSEKTLSAYWKSQDGDNPIGISLDYRWFLVPGTNMSQFESVSTQPVAPGSFKEVRIWGSPAVLVRGDFDWRMQPVEETAETELEWNEQNGLSLYWTDSEVAYLLWTYNPAVSPEDLIKMAESAQ